MTHSTLSFRALRPCLAVLCGVASTWVILSGWSCAATKYGWYQSSGMAWGESASYLVIFLVGNVAGWAFYTRFNRLCHSSWRRWLGLPLLSGMALFAAILMLGFVADQARPGPGDFLERISHLLRGTVWVWQTLIVLGSAAFILWLRTGLAPLVRNWPKAVAWAIPASLLLCFTVDHVGARMLEAIGAGVGSIQDPAAWEDIYRKSDRIILAVNAATFAAQGIVCIALWYAWLRLIRDRNLRGHCRRCGYELQDASDGKCPECGGGWH